MTIGVKFQEVAENVQVTFAGDAENMPVNFSSFSGAQGKSAYDIAVDNGFIGTEAEWLDTLRGKDGKTPIKGMDYFTETDKKEMVSAVISALPVYNGEVAVV